MKRFDFSLERVRRWRVQQAGLEELKLERLRAEMSRIESAQRGLEAEIVQAQAQVLSQPSIAAVELTSLGAYRLRMNQNIRELGNRISQYQAKIVEQRELVLEARRRAELLDRLREKALGKWRSAVDKEQEDLASEMFLARSRRNN